MTSPSGARLVGVLGGGQLGRMLALAGIPLGFRFRFLEPGPDPPVRDLGEVVRGDYDDPDSLRTFGKGLELATYEFENVPAAALERLTDEIPVFPPPSILALTQDRLREKEALGRLDIATADHLPVRERGELDQALNRLGVPAVLKTRRFGYDGKGQRVIRSPGGLDAAWSELGGRPLVLEAFVPFRRELSLIAVRDRAGGIVCYPLIENRHEGGILLLSRAPAEAVPADLQDQAEALVTRILEDQEYVGALAVEFFETDDGLLVNEVAPRVHNSGHWTQDGAVCSQFENHLRAIADLPLGKSEARGSSAMVNLIGKLPDPARILALPGTHLHLYGKAPRPGRKLGHVNVTGADAGQVDQRLAAVLSEIGLGEEREEGGQATQRSQRP